MEKNQPNDQKQSRSKIFAILVILMVLIILGLVGYIGFVSWQAVFQARQRYYEEVANLKKKDIQITIIEGWRREQIAAKLVELGILSSADEFLKLTENLEGKLFPDTYRFFLNSTAEEVVQKLTDNFTKKTPGLSVNQSALIMASVIEREAAKDEERAPIAGVYKNRLDGGIKLEADPTAQYARDSQKTEDRRQETDNFNFWASITKEEINSIDSPYNTYRYTGLPPGPICNPGSKSIEAAKNPEKHPFYYFFHAKDGQLILSRNVTDHDYQKTIYGVSQ